MSTPLTPVAAAKAAGQNQVPQLVAKIYGYPFLIGLGPVSKYVRIGDPNLVVGDGWVIGGVGAEDSALDIINLKGSSQTISQQINPDQGGSSSVPSFALNLVDVAGAMTELITPNVILDDILGTRVDLHVGYQETAYPQDFVRVISGIVDRVEGSSSITLNIAHPEQRKRSALFQKITTELTSNARYRSRDIQGITYITRQDVVTTVTITYITGGVAGSEVVTVVGTNITVQIQSGETTAYQVRNAIEKSIDALSLITLKVLEGFGGTPQLAQPTTALDTDTTLEVLDTHGMLLPNPAVGLRTYVRINDEVIEYTGLAATQITGCVRGALVSADPRARAEHHESGASVDTFYRLEGKAFDIALKLLTSGAGEFPKDGIQIKSINQVGEDLPVANAVYFEGVDLSVDFGVTINDTVTITGDSVPENNVIDALVSDIIRTTYGSYIVLGAESLLPNFNSSGLLRIKSKYDVLPEGCGLGLTGEEVDVPKFEEINDRYSSSMFTYDFYLKDTVEAEEFINDKVLFTTGAYSIPRLGKTSVAYNAPPLGIADLVRLDQHNTQSPQSNKIVRSINRFFYNAVVYGFNEAVVDERMLNGQVDLDNISRQRIRNTGSRPLVISCGGIRPTPENLIVMEILRQRFRDKYRFGAEIIEVRSFYGDTFNLDVGDSVVFGEGLNLPDTKNGSRVFAPRLWDIINKSLRIETGDVRLSLMDSAYSLANARYGVISPSSSVGVGSTANTIMLKHSFDIEPPRTEDQKWRSLEGIKIEVGSPDWSQRAETFFLGFSPSNPFEMIVNPPLPFVPQDDYVVNVAPYPDNDNAEDHALAKSLYVFVNPSVEVVDSSADDRAEVDSSEVPLFRKGAVVVVHNEDFTMLSPEVLVDRVEGNVIIFDGSLGFTPESGHEIELIGYKDKGPPYRFF